MPNWCYNNMVVYGTDYQEVKDFQNRLLEAQKKAEALGHWGLYQIYEEMGFKEQEILNSDSNGYIRGNFDYIQTTIHTHNGIFFFSVEYESAWGTMCEGFDFLLKHYKTLKEVTLAEECGNCVYVNTDKEGLFFKEKYNVYVEDFDTYLCETEKEVIDILNSYIKNEEDKVETIDDCFQILEENDGYIGRQYISLNEYGW